LRFYFSFFFLLFWFPFIHIHRLMFAFPFDLCRRLNAIDIGFMLGFSPFRFVAASMALDCDLYRCSTVSIIYRNAAVRFSNCGADRRFSV